VGGNGGSARRGVMPCAGPSTAHPSHARSAPAWPALHARTWCRGRVRFRPGGSKGAMCVRQLMIIDRGARPEARSRESPGPVPRGAQWSRPACWPARASHGPSAARISGCPTVPVRSIRSDLVPCGQLARVEGCALINGVCTNVVAELPDVLVAVSCSKNFGLYLERAAALIIVGHTRAAASLSPTSPHR
jgi:hypothetical protein